MLGLRNPPKLTAKESERASEIERERVRGGACAWFFFLIPIVNICKSCDFAHLHFLVVALLASQLFAHCVHFGTWNKKHKMELKQLRTKHERLLVGCCSHRFLARLCKLCSVYKFRTEKETNQVEHSLSHTQRKGFAVTSTLQNLVSFVLKFKITIGKWKCLQLCSR